MPELEGPKHFFTRIDFENALTEYAAAYKDNEVYVVGSMAILGLSSSRDLPVEITASFDIDLYPVHTEADGALAEELFGPNSDFHKKNGFTIEGVGDWTTMTTPPGWQERAIPFRTNTGVTALCLAPTDLAFNKIEAGRPKDLEHLRLFFKYGLVDPEELRNVIQVHSRHESGLQQNLERLGTVLKMAGGGG